MSRSDFKARFAGRCDERWSDLAPRGRGRWCARCETEVLDLSRMSHAEAVEATRGGACGRVRLDAEGDPIFREPPDRGPRRALVVLAALAGGCAGASAEPPEPPIAAAPPSPGPAMTPIPTGIAFEDLPQTERAALEAAVEEARAEVTPTEEQLALTAAKRRRRGHHAVAGPGPQPPVTEYLGMMIDPDF